MGPWSRGRVPDSVNVAVNASFIWRALKLRQCMTLVLRVGGSRDLTGTLL